MADAEQLQDALARAGNLYARLAALVPRGTRSQGAHTRMIPGSQVPIDADIVDHMLAIEQFLSAWNGGAEWRLDPDHPLRLRVACPYCGRAPLIVYRTRELIVCVARVPTHEGPRQWQGATEWRVLGRMLGTITDGRYGPRLPHVAVTGDWATEA